MTKKKISQRRGGRRDSRRIDSAVCWMWALRLRGSAALHMKTVRQVGLAGCVGGAYDAGQRYGFDVDWDDKRQIGKVGRLFEQGLRDEASDFESGGGGDFCGGLCWVWRGADLCSGLG